MTSLSMPNYSPLSSKDMNEIEKTRYKIHEIRGHKVMLDFDLAALYGVETRALNQAVKRNIERFPEDFMFQLTKGELEILRSQFVISNTGETQEDMDWKSQIDNRICSTR